MLNILDSENFAFDLIDSLPSNIDGVIIAHTDITKRKQAEEKLQEATQYIKQIISSAQEGVIVYDLNLRYQVWNSFMEELTGMTAGEVLGSNPRRLRRRFVGE